jgi:hypothetical protein
MGALCESSASGLPAFAVMCSPVFLSFGRQTIITRSFLAGSVIIESMYKQNHTNKKTTRNCLFAPYPLSLLMIWVYDAVHEGIGKRGDAANRITGSLLRHTPTAPRSS